MNFSFRVRKKDSGQNVLPFERLHFKYDTLNILMPFAKIKIYNLKKAWDGIISVHAPSEMVETRSTKC
jgi:hypothetical protein